MPKRTATTALLALLAVFCLLWPALVNHYPLLFPDTLGYLAAGRPVLHTLLHGGDPSTCMRSALYALAILPFHLNRTPWPILLFHAAPVVYTVYLTTRSITPRNALTKTLGLLAFLGTLTSLSWYICLLMPDILGAPLYLALYLLAFARATLTRTEQGITAAIAIFGAAAHTTHLIIATLLCVFFAIMLFTTKRTSRSNFAPVALRSFPSFAAALTVAASALLILSTNTRLYGHATFDGNRPPYLEARLLADGPAARYLHEHCPNPALPELCRRLDNLPANDDEFLWDDHGIWSTSTPPQQAELLHEELPLALRTLRTYPTPQLRISTHNFLSQLTAFDLDSFDNNDYMQSQLNTVLRNARIPYDRSLQAHNAVPSRFPSLLQTLTVLASLLALALTLRHTTPRLRALILTVLFVTIANAFLTGVFSEVDSRYQARIIWLIPFAAILALLNRRASPIEPPISSSPHEPQSSSLPSEPPISSRIA